MTCNIVSIGVTLRHLNVQTFKYCIYYASPVEESISWHPT
jgi:hypothetical protein